MAFFNLPPELRLQVYSQLLVRDERIVYVSNYHARLQVRSRKLYPALLRANKTVHDEASPLLYSNNYFRFPRLFVDSSFLTGSNDVAQFLCQIGSRANHIRHIHMAFPRFDRPTSGAMRLHDEHVQNLDLLHKVCPNIRSLELFLSPYHGCYGLNHQEVAAEAMDLLSARLELFTSLNEVTINFNDFEMYPSKGPDNGLMKKMHDYGWLVKKDD